MEYVLIYLTISSFFMVISMTNAPQYPYDDEL